MDERVPEPGFSDSTPDHEQESRQLLQWFDRNQRDLPWRRTDDPYAIWISEIMLQQTRVETVLPYYRRFLSRFPTVGDLAAASEEEVVGLWSGLGYYRRARHLHRAASLVAVAADGMPTDAKGLARLPGIGKYTAAAIASIAFGEVTAAIDGNVERVVTRYLALEGDPRRGEQKRIVEQTARAWLDEQRPGDSNQALMELGATICRPRSPLCDECPLSAGCTARREARPEAFPTPRSRPPTQRVQRWVAVVRDGDRLLLFQRHREHRQMPGMWEFPWAERDSAKDAAVELRSRYGGSWTVEGDMGTVRHAITNRAFSVAIVKARLSSDSCVAEGPEAGWFTLCELDELPKSSLVGKVLAKIGERRG